MSTNALTEREPTEVAIQRLLVPEALAATGMADRADLTPQTSHCLSKSISCADRRAVAMRRPVAEPSLRTGLNTVQRRTTATCAAARTGRRPGVEGPAPTAARPEDLTDTQFSTMWNALIDTGTIGMTLLTA